MDSNPTGKENVHAAASRFGFAGATKPKTTSASVATQKRTTSAGVALQSKDGAASADADPYNLRKMAIDAMPDDTEQYHEVTRKLKQANKGKAWDNKSKCAHAVRQTRAALQTVDFVRLTVWCVRTGTGRRKMMISFGR